MEAAPLGVRAGEEEVVRRSLRSLAPHDLDAIHAQTVVSFRAVWAKQAKLPSDHQLLSQLRTGAGLLREEAKRRGHQLAVVGETPTERPAEAGRRGKGRTDPGRGR